VNDAAANPVFESVADNAVYTFQSTAPDQFPLHTSRIGSFNEFRASKTLLDTLNGLSDPRMPIFFRPTPATRKVQRQPGVCGYSQRAERRRRAAIQRRTAVPVAYRRVVYFENAVSTDGLAIAKGVIMTYAELQFLLAEAAERGLTANSAETLLPTV
jgi:hypothetical protein